MPGIFGIIDSKDKICSLNLANNMREILRYDESYKDYLHISDYCVMGSTTPAYFNAITQPVYSKDKTLCAVMEGEIFNSDSLIRELKNEGIEAEVENDAELLLRFYQAYGSNLVNKVNGMFNLALWNEKEKSLILINDRLGIHYLYYYSSNDRLITLQKV